ncbi:MAG: hypothetical protein ACXVY3_05025 [Gaiellaceae bacterium]
MKPPSASFKATRNGSYAFKARVRKFGGSGGAAFSTALTIHVR